MITFNVLNVKLLKILKLHFITSVLLPTLLFQHFMNSTEYSCGYDKPREVYWIRHADLTVGKLLHILCESGDSIIFLKF